VQSLLLRMGLAGPGRPLSAFYAALFAIPGVHLAFGPIWYDSRGLSHAEIGLALAIGLWVRIFAHMGAGMIADRLGERRRVLIWLGVGALISHLSFLWTQGFAQVTLVVVIATLFSAPLFSLGENLGLLVARERSLDYGRMRLWGSVSFLAVTLGAGVLLKGLGVDLVIWLMAAGIALTISACWMLPDIRTPPAPSRWRGAARLVRNRAFLVFLLAGGLGQTSHAMIYGFGSLHWRAAGMPENVIGLLWGVGVVAEIGLFAFGQRLVEHLGPVRLLAVGAAGGVIRWALTALLIDPYALAALQLLHALTFGAAHLGAMHFMLRAAPENASASAQALYSSLATGMLMGLGMAAAGWGYDRFGAPAFWGAAVVSALALTGAFLLGRLWDGGRFA